MAATWVVAGILNSEPENKFKPKQLKVVDPKIDFDVRSFVVIKCRVLLGGEIYNHEVALRDRLPQSDRAESVLHFTFEPPSWQIVCPAGPIRRSVSKFHGFFLRVS